MNVRNSAAWYGHGIGPKEGRKEGRGDGVKCKKGTR